MAVKRSLKRRILASDLPLLAGIAVVVSGLIASGFYGQRSMQGIREATNLRAQARKTAFEITTLHLLLERAETSQRGYIITGEERYLAPYHQSLREVDAEFGKLREMLREDREQISRFTELEDLSRKKLAKMNEILELKRAGRGDEAVREIKKGLGQSYMEYIRRLTEEMGRVQDAAVSRYSLRADEIIERSSRIVLVGNVVAVLAVMLTLLMLNRNQSRRAKVNSALNRIVKAQQEISAAGFASERIMTVLVDHARELTGADGAVVELLEGQEMIYHFASGSASQFLGLRINVNGSFSGASVNSGQSQLCTDTETDARVNREACRKVNVRSMVVAPLRHEGKTIGVIKCYSAEPGRFSQEDCGTLELVAGFLASALSRATEFNQKTVAVTELENAKSELIAARDQAEAATRAKSQFLANISHEVRTPLHGILGLGRLLAETPLTAEQKEFADNIVVAGDGLLRIVNDVLDLSKVEAGKLELEQVDFDVRYMVEETVKTFRAANSSKKLKLDTDVDRAIPQHLKGDPTRLRQILLNLIGNAIKFTAEGGIKVRVRRGMDCILGEDMGLRFEVEDTGEGIAADKLANLFQDFSQADLSTTRRFGGTGLGLAICKRLVEQMHGKIGVISELGQGTTFWFTVSMKEGRAVEKLAETAGTVSLRSDGRPWRILVADDNSMNQKIAVKTLEKLGLTCDVADNGLQVLERAREKAYDLILMDCHMPEMDGYQATVKLREGGTACSAKVVILALTASAMKEEMERCLAMGMDDFVSKPFTLKQLAFALEKWFAVIEMREHRPTG